MSSALTFPSTTTPDLVLPPYPVRKFSVDDYFKLMDSGVLGEDDNVELLEGWIVPKMVKKPPHDGTIDIVLTRLSRLLPNGWYIRVQNVLQTTTSAPEPDLVITRGECDSFTDRHPQGSDAGLVIEVA